MEELSEQQQVRRNSLAALRDMGIEPYPAALYPVDAYTDEIKENFDDALEPARQVCVAGRIMSRRIMGKASFMELQDSRGRIQVYVSRDDLCPGEDKEMYNVVFKKLLDIGDFIGVCGYVFRTKTGEDIGTRAGNKAAKQEPAASAYSENERGKGIRCFH